MNFKQIKISGWKQFGEINIDFHPRMTILTGANGSGKTTILNILARHFGWDAMELSTPVKDEANGIIRFIQSFIAKLGERNKIGTLIYSDGSATDLILPNNNSAQVHIEFPTQKAVEGVNVPSHRPHFNYQQVSQLSVQKRGKDQAFQLVKDSNHARLSGGGNHKTSNYFIKETLITWGVYGFGNAKVTSDQEQIDFYNDFEEVLRKMLPPSIGFTEFSIRNGEIVLVTKSGQFMIDAVSGGISAIIDLAWQVFMYSKKERQEYVVLIDEVENHLHPTLQRSILPNLLETFPKVQFIVTTHNPLTVGSVRDSNVFALQYRESEDKINRVHSTKLDLVNKAKAASDVLRDILGVEFTMPLWVEDKLKKITEKYSKDTLTEANLTQIRSELKELGLEDLMPQTLINILENGKDQ
jgi:predicted ATP-dependent endonuclease of OLD family